VKGEGGGKKDHKPLNVKKEKRGKGEKLEKVSGKSVGEKKGGERGEGGGEVFSYLLLRKKGEGKVCSFSAEFGGEEGNTRGDV